MEIKSSNSGWLTFIVCGLVAIIYALLALLLPDGIIETVMLISGIGLIVTGVISFLFALRRRKLQLPWGALLIEAIAMVVLGIVAIVWSKETVKAIIFIMGLWTVVIGVLMLLVIFSRRFLINRGFYIASAALSILFGILLLVNPFESAKVFIVITGIIALTFGIIMMMFGFTLRRVDKGISVEVVD